MVRCIVRKELMIFWQDVKKNLEGIFIFPGIMKIILIKNPGSIS